LKVGFMRVFRIDKDGQEQFAQLPEVAMDMNFGQAGGDFYLVLTCAIAILLDENTFVESDSSFFRRTSPMQGISAEERTANLQNWFNELPRLRSAATATPAQAWQSFWGAMSPVTPVGSLPPAPPRPPVIYGHLPFKATTLPETVIYRWEAYPTSRRIDRTKNPPTIAPDTYAAPASEVPFAPTGFGAVARFALPNVMPACYRYELQPIAGTPIECGAAVPLYGQSGGGVEVKFTILTDNRCAIADPVVLPAL
jgi:hypothetical protein